MIALLLFTACAQPLHMQYDFGRATLEATQKQADITRPSVKDAVYPMSGTEAELLRANVEKKTGEEKSGNEEAIQ